VIVCVIDRFGSVYINISLKKICISVLSHM